MLGASAALSGGKLADQLLEQSGMRPGPKVYAGTFDPPPGWKEEQAEKVRRYQERFFGMKPGET